MFDTCKESQIHNYNDERQVAVLTILCISIPTPWTISRALLSSNPFEFHIARVGRVNLMAGAPNGSLAFWAPSTFHGSPTLKIQL